VLAVEKLRRRARRKRQATGVIYGPNGEILRTVEIPADYSSGA
jgi:hypothetical protein